jgi:hypothetical protein
MPEISHNAPPVVLLNTPRAKVAENSSNELLIGQSESSSNELLIGEPENSNDELLNQRAEKRKIRFPAGLPAEKRTARESSSLGGDLHNEAMRSSRSIAPETGRMDKIVQAFKEAREPENSNNELLNKSAEKPDMRFEVGPRAEKRKAHESSSLDGDFHNEAKRSRPTTPPHAGRMDKIIQGFKEACDNAEETLKVPPTTAFGKYVKFNEDDAALMAEIKPKEGSDSNHMKIDVLNLRNQLENLIRKYSVPEGTIPDSTSPGVVFGPVPLADAERYAKQWGGLPCVKLGDGSAVVTLNLKPLETMLKEIGDEKPGADGKVDWLIGRFQAFNATFNSQYSQIEGQVNMLSEHARNGNAQFTIRFDALMSAMNSIKDILAQYARGIG